MIEANIRIRQQELKDEEERMQKRQYVISSSRSRSGEIENSSITGIVLHSRFNYSLQYVCDFLCMHLLFSLFFTCLRCN